MAIKFRNFAIGIALLAGCSPAGRQAAHKGDSPQATAPIPVQATPDTTGAVNEDGRPFSNYTKDNPEITQLKQEQNTASATKSLAANIEHAQVDYIPDNQVPANINDSTLLPAVEVAVKWKDVDSPLIFRGPLKKMTGDYQSDMTETTGQRADLFMHATCADIQCNAGAFSISDSNNNKTIIVIQREDRILKVKVPDDPTYAPDETPIVEEYKKGKKVKVTSTQVVGGTSYISLIEINPAPKEEPVKIEGENVEPGGGCAPLKANAQAKKTLGNNFCAIANDDHGHIIIEVKDTNPETPTTEPAEPGKPHQNKNTKITKAKKETETPPTPSTVKKKKPLFIELEGESGGNPEPQEDQGPENGGGSVGGKDCPISVSSNANAKILSIIKDCANPIIVKTIKNDFAKKSSGWHHRLTDFLNLYDLGTKDNPTGRALEFSKMLKILTSANFPEVFSFVTMVESDFNANAVPKHNSHGELGYWQFTPDTARRLSLPLEQRRQIAPSTKAAVKFFSGLLKSWNDDVKMALAAYNWGPENVSENSAAYKQRLELIDDSSLTTNAAIYKDFWVLCHNHMIANTTCQDYVPHLIGAIFAGVSTNYYGIDAPQIEMK